MNINKENLVDIKQMPDSELLAFMKKNSISLKVDEARLVTEKLRRNPTLTELHIFNTEWSEHASYKSSREVLKQLPTEGKNVILGPSEDSGIIELGVHNGEKYGIVISHESHNHPSQVVPYEGAATGIGGILRDVLCMGARIIATADPLRFGNPFSRDNKIRNRTRYIANAVIDGIAGYGNPVGIPNIAGDIYFNDSFEDNCLVNVVCLGLVKEKNIIHSYAPKNSEGYDIIVVGKATDNSGFGGSAFASLVLDEDDAEANKGAVQVPDPFLKNMLIRATGAVFEQVRKKNISVGFKDMGAGGIMCATSELASAGGVGADINLDNIHVSMKNLPPYIIACSETQERFAWIVPPDFTPTVLRIYNEDFELPNVSEGARASVVGRITKEKDYVLRHNGKIVCNAPVDEVTSGIKYEREAKEPKTNFTEPKMDEPKDYNSVLLKLLSHPNICSRRKVYEHYDTNVLGNTVIAPGCADAGLLAPIRGSSLGIALSVDANPRYSRISPYWGAVNAVCESMRNVAAIGAVPSALTDCLNFGNPEVPEAFWQFSESVKGISDAASKLCYKPLLDNGEKQPVPIISGNVSFYNENAKGKAVDPSPVIACIGVMEDYSRHATTAFKRNNGSVVYLLGQRRDELGGSAYYELFDKLGANVPKPDFEKQRAMIYSVIEAVNKGILLSCHDISEGGIAACLAEMAILSNTGCEIDISVIGAASEPEAGLRDDKLLFSESPGFVAEVNEKNKQRFEKLLVSQGVDFYVIGKTSGNNLVVKNDDKELVNLSVDEMKQKWEAGLVDALS